MSDDQVNAVKNYSCKYCKKHFSRSSIVVNMGGFEETQQVFNHTLVVY